MVRLVRAAGLLPLAAACAAAAIAASEPARAQAEGPGVAAPAAPSGPASSARSTAAPAADAGPAAPGARAAEPGTPAATASLDPAALGAFFDGLVAGLLEARRIPGAVVLVVAEGRVLFARGYGVADLESRRPVDPETTLFRVASVSKLVTATAAMQLVEQGKLELDADVNRWLADFQVPEAYGRPVTLRHLLTHTGGFDDAFLDSLRPLGSAPEPLGTVLAQGLPRRIRPPGEVIDYSNRGIALVGHLVERASGRPFDAYVREHVLAPLGMARSGFHLPSPPPPELATGYDWRDGRFEPRALDEMRYAPAGAFFTTAGEFARFLLAHLALGRIDGLPPHGAPADPAAASGEDPRAAGGTTLAAPPAPAPRRLLREETAREMQRTQFRNHPALPGWCLGFLEERIGGRRVVGHGGDWRGYGTRVVLVPDANVGLFVSTTRSYDARFFDPLLDAFFARWLPAPGGAAAGGTWAPARGAAVADRSDYLGTYLPVRRMRHEFLKLGLLMSELRVQAGEHGSLVLAPPEALRDPARLLPAGTPDVFAVEGDVRQVAFLRDASGRVTRLSVDAFAFDRVPAWQAPRVHALAAVGCFAVFAGTVAGLPLAALRRRPPERAAGAPPAARALAWASSLAGGVFLVGLAAALAGGDPFAWMESVPARLRALFVLPLIVAGFALALLVALLRPARARNGGLRPRAGAGGGLARLHLWLVLAAAVLFVAGCWTWNLLGLPS